MTLNELMERASSEYPDDLIAQVWDFERGCPRDNPGAGDTLALFIAREIADTYSADLGDHHQLREAARVIRTAAGELQRLAAGLEPYEH